MRLEHIVCDSHVIEITPLLNLIDTTFMIGRNLHLSFPARRDTSLSFRLYCTGGRHLPQCSPPCCQHLSSVISFSLSRRDGFSYNPPDRGGVHRRSRGREDYNRVIIRSRRAVQVLWMSYRLGLRADLEIINVNLMVIGMFLRKGVEKALKVWPAWVGIIRRIQIELCLHCEIDEEGWFFSVGERDQSTFSKPYKEWVWGVFFKKRKLTFHPEWARRHDAIAWKGFAEMHEARDPQEDLFCILWVIILPECCEDCPLLHWARWMVAK